MRCLGSDQYDVRLQIAGVAFDADELVVRGTPESGAFAVFHMRGGRVLAVEAVNAAAEFVIGKRLIGAATPVRREFLADTAVPMKSFLAA
jgi:3-phenylpropionate/trans-cinnamate dioxygenase ferredoxin reductase subunit